MAHKPIPREDLESQIGLCIHLDWARPGCVWILESIEGDEMTLRRQRAKKHEPRLKSHVKHACYTYRNEPGVEYTHLSRRR